MNKKITDAEKRKNEVINFVTQTVFYYSTETEIPTSNTFLTPHGSVSNPEQFGQKPATHNSSLKLDADDQFSSENETLQVS